MAWLRTGNKPLSEPMIVWFTDAYMCHLASMSKVSFQSFVVYSYLCHNCLAKSTHLSNINMHPADSAGKKTMDNDEIQRKFQVKMLVWQPDYCWTAAERICNLNFAASIFWLMITHSCIHLPTIQAFSNSKHRDRSSVFRFNLPIRTN